MFIVDLIIRISYWWAFKKTKITYVTIPYMVAMVLNQAHAYNYHVGTNVSLRRKYSTLFILIDYPIYTQQNLWLVTLHFLR